MRVSQNEEVRQIRWGSNDPRSEKSIPLSWTTGLSAATPAIATVIDRALNRGIELKRALKTRKVLRAR